MPEGKIENRLKENKNHFVYVSPRENDGFLSITGYKLKYGNKKYSLLDVSLITGRKNRIRVQLAWIGSPVAGDKKYGAKTDPVRRICLHSSSLEIIHPVKNEFMIFNSKIPPEYA